ncbi:phosphodiester glycosidase family protein [Paenibacillus soyae]|uniref:Phosphodiester glycosidase family protein n=1 Tax=Paenibacillus soyae TaxID=2969249 RepID=A0A9X2MSL3_9BACL|nr:phosphodiester glycosidase family protein [Paenibacillus soyae]MCR2805113.1 phosphodiester glycosidase family protein [Paenibacillus soyae]
MKVRQRAASLVLALMMLISLLAPAVQAGGMDPPATTYGQVIDKRQTELAPGATYTWYDMETERGTQKAHFVSFHPGSMNLELVAGTKSGKVRGMEGVTQMAAYADAPGSRVIAGINGDFYEISGNATGVPNGLFIGGGKILNSSTSAFAFGLRSDGTSIYGSPILQKNITIEGTVTPITHINRFRSDNQLVLYTTDYYTSTMTSNEGDEVVLDILSGDVKHGAPMQLKVAEVRAGQGNSPLNAGQVVLSASGGMRAVLAGLEAGDEVTAEFTLSGEWSDVQVAIGGMGPLIKDGIVQTGVGPAGVHPRTAIGTKADGTIVLFEIDGRQPGFSEGVETHELAAIMADLGVVNAMNLDGGGSSTLAAKLPGGTAFQVMNSPSDGGERKTGNSLLLVNKAPELGTAASLAVRPNAERILAGSSFAFQALGVDANGHPAQLNGTPEWQVEASLGTVDASGTFTAGAQAGTGPVTVQADGVQGAAEIEVVDQLTAIAFPDEVKTYESGMQDRLSVVATRSGQVIQAGNESFEWSVEGEIGSVDENGVFTATSENGKIGRIIAKYGQLEASMNVSVGIPPAMLEDFESGLANYTQGGAAYNTVTIAEETNPDFVRSGDTSLKLTYDFTGKTGTSGAYLQAKSTETRIQVPGYPQKISMWVYGDGKKHWLRMQMRDGNNGAFPLDFTEQTTGVTWTGWRYVEANVPAGKTPPFTIDMPVRYMETSNAKKDAGAIYVDDIRALYGAVEEDIAPPVIRDISPAANHTVRNAHPTISAIAEDDGYDPVQHPATTLIDPASIRVYLDDQPVQHGLYPPKGTITYSPTEPLTEGRHKAKVAVRDLSGNQTIKEWYFNVNLGSPQYLYESPAELFAGETYEMPIKAESAAKLKGGHAEYKFDPAAAGSFEVIRGPKLTEAQATAAIDETEGIVRAEFADLESAALTDDDVLATIRYTVKSDVIGPIGLEQSKGEETTLPHTIEFLSGSIVMIEGDGAPRPFYGAPIESTIRTKLKLLWTHANIALGQPAEFVISENGVPVEGATLLLNGSEIAGGQLSDAAGKLTTSDATTAVGTFQVQAKKGDAYSPVITFPVASYAGEAAPFNMNVSMGEEATTSRQLTWHTHPDSSETVVEWAPKAAFTDFGADNVTRTEGSSSLYNSNNDGTYRVHKAVVTGLAPDTAYVYRVGDGDGNVSAQGEFRTSAATGDSLKLLFFGDSQASDQAGFDQWGASLEAALADMPDAELLIHAGDMVDHGHEEEQWKMWFGAAQHIFMNHTLLTVVGNHEVTGTNGAGDYLAHFHNPQNGPASAKGSAYSFDVKDTHFAMLNTELGTEAMQEQAEWLDRDLAASDKKWKVVVFHQGPYGSIYSNENVQTRWVPVFDKHQVDLVLNGHDHIYLRTFPMKGGEIVKDGEGTRYVIGGSTGPKYYDRTERYWQEVVFDENVNIYTAVEIAGDAITLTAKTVTGELVDTFDIVKKEKPTPLPVPIPTPAPTVKPGQLALKDEQLKPAASGKAVVIQMEGLLSELTIPGDAAELLDGSDLIVQSEALRLTLPSEWLQEVAAKLPADLRGDGVLTLHVERVEEQQAHDLLEQASGQADAELQAASGLLAFHLVVADSSGKKTSVSRFEHPLTVAIAAQGSTDRELTGIYFISDEGELEYAGGAWKDGWLSAELTHFSVYAALEFRKPYRDVAAGHWAADAIAALTAWQVAQGVEADRFDPENRVTRAEFAALLVRALKLQEQGQGEAEAEFADVPETAWYADEVGLAVEAGIVTGTGNGEFAPDDEVTRQEMAAMIVRAHAYRTGEAVSGDSLPQSFSDMAEAPEWARQAVAEAHKLNLMQGYPGGEFRPEGTGTRAQAAQLVYNLLRFED